MYYVYCVMYIIVIFQIKINVLSILVRICNFSNIAYVFFHSLKREMFWLGRDDCKKNDLVNYLQYCAVIKWYLFGIWLQYNHLDKSIRLDLHRAPHWHIQAYKRPSRNVFRHILCGIYTWPTLLVDDGGHKCGCGTHNYRHSHTSTPPPQLCSCSKKWSLKRNHT